MLMFTSGAHMVWTSTALPILYSVNSTIPTTLTSGSIMGSISLLSNLPSSPVAAMCSDQFGRKTVLFVAPVLYFIGWLMIAFAETANWIIAAKVIVGFGDGSVHTILPMYIGEIAQDSNRGSLGMLITVMLDLGILYSYTISPWLSIKTMAIASSVIPFMTLLLFLQMPESPYYYLLQKKETKAKNILKILRGGINIETEFETMSSGVAAGIAKDEGGWTDLFMAMNNLKPLLILFGILTIQQFSGISAILVYSGLIFEKTGGVVNERYGPMLVGAVQLITDLLAMSVINLINRRTFLYISCLGCFVAFAIQTYYFYMDSIHHFSNHRYVWVPIFVILLYIIAYSVGLGSIPTVLSSELFPTSIRAKGMSTLDNYSDISAFIVTAGYQYFSKTSGNFAPFLFFTIMSLLGVVFVRFCVPETRGRSFEGIQRILRG